jgi:hypothetical protein
MAFTRVLEYIKYILIEFTPSIILLYPSSPIPRIISTGVIFPFYIHVCTAFAPYSPFTAFPPPPLPSDLYQPPKALSDFGVKAVLALCNKK